MILIFFITASIYWLLMSILSYNVLQKTFKKYQKEPQIQTPLHYDGFLRMDFQKWDKKALTRRCFTHFPLNLFAMTSFLIIYAICITLWRHLKLPHWIVDLIRNKYGRNAIKICMKLQQQFDPNEKINTAIMISNHVCFMDIMYYGMRFKTLLGFVSKKDVASYPVIGYIADFLQCLYIDRSSQDARIQIKKDIQTRVNPLIIFPEGTVSNGRSVMQFKNGAFQSLSPLTIVTLRYQSKHWHFSESILDTLQHIFLALCADVTLKVRKTVISPKQGETVDYYRERCRQRVAQLGGFKKYDCSYKDVLQYNKLRKQKIKQLKTKI